MPAVYQLIIIAVEKDISDDRTNEFSLRYVLREENSH